jgi:hypothetical protein
MGRGDSYQLQGQEGGIVLSSPGQTSAAGPFRWVQVVTDTVFDDFISANIDNSTSLQGKTIPAGIGIGGVTTFVDVISGTVICYRA